MSTPNIKKYIHHTKCLIFNDMFIPKLQHIQRTEESLLKDTTNLAISCFYTYVLNYKFIYLFS